jgi:regulator of replication initiation timing
MSSKGRMLVQRGSGIDKDALTDWETDIIEGDRITQGDSWNWMQNQPFNGTITQLMTMFQSDLKADSGANQFTRGETTGGIVSGKAINSLIQAGGKVAALRTEQLKYGDKGIAEQIGWLQSQFYEDGRVVMIVGRQNAIRVDTERLFGKKSKGAVNPPPYTVQIEIASRDPQRIADQNQMFMEAYTMSAQAQQFFPLSALFRILNLDGKDKILPVIQANETYQQQMQQMQMQVQQMGQQMQQMAEENQNLKRVNNQMTDTLSQMSARRGGAVAPNATKVAEAGGGQETASAIVNASRGMVAGE